MDKLCMLGKALKYFA